MASGALPWKVLDAKDARRNQAARATTNPLPVRWQTKAKTGCNSPQNSSQKAGCWGAHCTHVHAMKHGSHLVGFWTESVRRHDQAALLGALAQARAHRQRKSVVGRLHSQVVLPWA
eukprot:364266-Chlamydomonas_euryale.AAC.10